MNLGWALLTLTIYMLACARVTRLINFDIIADPLRVAITRRARATDASPSEQRRWAKAAYFVECAWCISFWVCLASAYLPVHVIGWPWWVLFPLALAASHVIGLLALLDDDEDAVVEDRD